MKDRAVIVIYHATEAKLLLRMRDGKPYRGLLDFVSGHHDTGEDALDCAYRALASATGISREDIALQHIMDFAYHTTQWCVQVFAGRLTREVELSGEAIDSLVWVDAEGNFFDVEQYAGEGYIGHILSHMEMQLFTTEE